MYKYLNKRHPVFLFIIIGFIMLADQSYAGRSMAGLGEAMALASIFYYTLIQLVLTGAYCVLWRVIKKYEWLTSLGWLFNAIYLVSSFLYIHMFATGAYLFFIYNFLLLLFLFKWSKRDTGKTIFSRTMACIYFILTFSWYLSPDVPKTASAENYWFPPFGSGMWGAINAGYYTFNAGVFFLLLIIFAIIFKVNSRLYHPESPIKPDTRLLAQFLLCLLLALLSMSLFEPSISGPISRLLVDPQNMLKSTDARSYNECLRWAEYYGIEIPRSDSPEFADAYRLRAHRHLRNGNYRKAASDYLDSLQHTPRYKNYYNYRRYQLNYLEYAWLLATCPDDAVRDGARATELTLKAIEWADINVIGMSVNELADPNKDKGIYSYSSIILLEVLAAAYAEDGQFEKASEKQEKAVRLINSIKTTDEKRKNILATQLESYRHQRPWRNVAESTMYRILNELN